MMELKENLRNMQNEINKAYQEHGLTDEILEKQLLINQQRNEHNIPDETEFWFGEFTEDGFKEFVQ